MSDPLKEIKPYLQRADEMQAHNPKVSYYCRMWAVLVAMKMPKTPELSAKLNELVGQMEADAAALNLDQEADAKELEAFAISIFDNADKVDRAGGANLQTAGTFYASSVFLDALRQFHEDDSLPAELEQKQKYAVWKAADIRKALREGRTPTPGTGTIATSPEDDEALLREAGMAVELAPEASTSAGAGPLPPAPPPPPFPGHAGASAPPPPPPPPHGQGPLNDWSHLRPTLPDLPSAPPAATTDANATPLKPPSGLPPVVSPNPLLAKATSHHVNPPPPPSTHYVAPVGVSSPSAATAHGGGGASYGRGGLDPKRIVDAKKEAKNAASALDFDDVGTAIQCLQRALDILQAQQPRR